MSAPDTLAARYGAPAPWRRRALVIASVALAAVFLGWLGWTAWGHSTPAVRSSLETWSVEGQHAATATVVVSVAEDVEATCRLRAFAEDHNVVGEVSFTPEAGSNRRQVAEIRTEREATSVELLGCTAPGQNRPQ